MHPQSEPRITVEYVGSGGPIDGTCEDTDGPTAFLHNDHYHCDLILSDIPEGDLTISIHLDDAIDPSTIPADRVATVEVEDD